MEIKQEVNGDDDDDFDDSNSSNSSPGYEGAFLSFLHKRKEDVKASTLKKMQNNPKKFTKEIKKECLDDTRKTLFNRNLSMQTNQPYFPVPAEKINCKIITKNQIERNNTQQKPQYVFQPAKDEKDETIKLQINPQTTLEIRNIVLPKDNSNNLQSNSDTSPPIQRISQQTSSKYQHNQDESTKVNLNIIKKEEVGFSKTEIKQISKESSIVTDKSQQQQQMQQFNVNLKELLQEHEDVSSPNIKMILNPSQIKKLCPHLNVKTIQKQEVGTTYTLNNQERQQVSSDVLQQQIARVQNQIDHVTMTKNVPTIRKLSSNGNTNNSQFDNEINAKKKSRKSSVSKNNTDLSPIKFINKFDTYNNSQQQRVVLASSPGGQMPVLTKVEAIDSELLNIEETYAPPLLAPQEITTSNGTPTDIMCEQQTNLVSNCESGNNDNKMLIINSKYYTINNCNKSISNNGEHFVQLSSSHNDSEEGDRSILSATMYKSLSSPSKLNDDCDKIDNDFVYLKTDFNTFEKSLQNIENTVDGCATAATPSSSTSGMLMVMDSPLSSTLNIQKDVNDSILNCDKIETHNLDEVVSDMLVRNVVSPASSSLLIQQIDNDKLDLDSFNSNNSNKIVKNNVIEEATVMPNNNSNNLSKFNGVDNNVNNGSSMSKVSIRNDQDKKYDERTNSHDELAKRKSSKHHRHRHSKKSSTHKSGSRKKTKLLPPCKIQLEDVMQKLNEKDRKKLLANQTIQAKSERNKERIAKDYVTPKSASIQKKPELPSVRKHVNFIYLHLTIED